MRVAFRAARERGGTPMDLHMPQVSHVPHPHLEARKAMFLKARKGADDFNSKLAVRITNIVGTMWCAYAFACLALISFPAAVRAGTATLVAWFAQTFLQLVLLSIIMVGQKVAAAKSDMQLEQTYRDAEALLEINDDVHKLVKQNVLLTEQVNELLDQNTELTRQINALNCKTGKNKRPPPAIRRSVRRPVPAIRLRRACARSRPALRRRGSLLRPGCRVARRA
jgi:hypothetical protein